MGTVDDFLASVDDERRTALQDVVAAATRVVPSAEQGTSYGMASLLYRGRPLLGLASAKAHLSIFPFSPDVVAAVGQQLAGYSLSKGTIRFTADTPLPVDVVAEVVRLRRDEIDDALDRPATGDARSSP